MRNKFKPLAAALVGAGLLAGAAHAQTGTEFRFSGFGTLAATYSDERRADFVSTIFQPNGPGYTRPWAITPDSKFGMQMDAVFSDRISAVVQVVAQHRHDNSFMPQVEWANLKYQATSDLSVRVGRIATPTFLVSDTRFVGYAQPWIRPPVEVYGVLPITSNDGVDLSWRSRFGDASNTVQAYYGRATARLKTGEATSKPGWGVIDTVQLGDLSLRAGYSANRVDIDFPGITTLVNGINNFAALPAPVGPQAAALAAKYSTRDMHLGAFSLAANYDPGKWFVMAEFVDLNGEGFLVDSRSWYVTGGYRMGSFTPYATYARTRSRVTTEPGIPLPAAAPLNAGINAALNNQFNGSQSTLTLGVRWDVMKNTALKAQYDRIDLAANSAGRLANVQPGFVRGGNVNLFSAALDFVF